jgi:phage-related protein
MLPAPKPLSWLGDSLDVVRGFGQPVSLLIGQELRRVQNGVEPRNWKPMPIVGPGVREIRVSAGGEFRVIYIAANEDGIVVLHAFRKKTQKTSQPDIAKARLRLRAI